MERYEIEEWEDEVLKELDELCRPNLYLRRPLSDHHILESQWKHGHCLYLNHFLFPLQWDGDKKNPRKNVHND